MSCTMCDPGGRLTSVTNGFGELTTWTYDGLGRRVMSSSAADGTRVYVYDGDLLIGEVTVSGGEATPAVAYTWGANGLVSERFLTGTPKSLWYHFGPQGETRQLTDSTGTVADSYLYTAYGEPVASSGTDRNPFQYGGQVGYYTGPGAGLVLCGARWYNPYTARWMTRDPIGYAGGENLYGYCGESPVVGLDPDGTYGPRVHVGKTRYWLGTILHIRHDAAGAIATADGDVDRYNYPDQTKSLYPTREYHMANYVNWNPCQFDDRRPGHIQQHLKRAREAAKRHDRLAVWRNLGICLHIIQDTAAHGNAMWHRPYLDDPTTDIAGNPDGGARLVMARRRTLEFMQAALKDKDLASYLRGRGR